MSKICCVTNICLMYSNIQKDSEVCAKKKIQTSNLRSTLYPNLNFKKKMEVRSKREYDRVISISITAHSWAIREKHNQYLITYQ